MSLDTFLAKKPLYYDIIDYTRMPRAYTSIKEHLLLPPVIHVVGTNGKGTTGRFLSLMLRQAGFLVGHYTSPHLFAFNERLWLDGKNVSIETLEALHVRLQSLLSPVFIEELSYFEYTTLLAALAFEKCDYVVMEAGLGGEYDATNVFPKMLSIITPIGMDHESFLGNSLVAIATTKLNSITTQTILSKQYDEAVIDVAKKISIEKDVPLLCVADTSLVDESAIDIYCMKNNYPTFFNENLKTATLAANQLGVYPHWETLLPLDLPGRCQKITPNITVDVGHNPMAAARLAQSFPLKSQILVYNSFKDKDFAKILALLMPIVKEVQLIPIKTYGRAVDEEGIIHVLDTLAIPWRPFDERINPEDCYLVFGSFMVAESFLERIDA